MMMELNTEILNIMGNNAWFAFPHTLAMRLDSNWLPFPHLTRTSEILSGDIARGDGRDIVVGPPRNGKTELCVDKVSKWHLKLWPQKTILFCSYSEDFARERVRLIRNSIQQNKSLLGIRLAEDSQASDRFHLVEGGGIYSAGIGSGVVGLPADLWIIDDIFKSWEESQNAKARRKVIEWFESTYSRLQPKASVLIVGAMWHTEDLQNFLVKHHSDSWRLISFPALSPGEDLDLLKRPKGKALCPQLYDEVALERIRKAVGPEKWAAQYQQSPLPEIEIGAEIVFDNEVIGKIRLSDLPPLTKMQPNTKAAVRYLAFDPGKRKSHSAIVVSEMVDIEDTFELHILHLKQYPLGYRVSKIIEELDEFSLDPRFGELAPIILVDRSGPQGDIVVELMQKGRMFPIIGINIISSGKGKNKFTGLKSDLVENLQNLIDEDRFRYAEGLEELDILFDELRAYRRQPSPKGRSISYRPYSLATDDFVDCLALITFAAEKGLRPLYVRESVGLYGNKGRRPLSGNRGDYAYNLKNSSYAQFNKDYANLRG